MGEFDRGSAVDRKAKIKFLFCLPFLMQAQAWICILRVLEGIGFERKVRGKLHCPWCHECLVRALKEMVCISGQMLSRLPADVRERLRKGFAGKLPALFSIGELCIYVDLSLRRNGYGERIDRELQTALSHMRGEFGEQLERWLLEASSRFLTHGRSGSQRCL
jgi:hypothetical protein